MFIFLINGFITRFHVYELKCGWKTLFYSRFEVKQSLDLDLGMCLDSMISLLMLGFIVNSFINVT